LRKKNKLCVSFNCNKENKINKTNSNMTPELRKIKDVKNNSKNPRVIKDAQFRKLVQSIKEFPEMLKLRPIVLDEDGVILGGNMRFRASIEAGLKEVWVTEVKDWTEKQKQEFIVKDNSSFGEWDWDVLANQFDLEALDDWGLDIPTYLTDEDEEPEFDENLRAHELERYLANDIKQIVLFIGGEKYEEYLDLLGQLIEDNDELEPNTDAILWIMDEFFKNSAYKLEK